MNITNVYQHITPEKSKCIHIRYEHRLTATVSIYNRKLIGLILFKWSIYLSINLLLTCYLCAVLIPCVGDTYRMQAFIIHDFRCQSNLPFPPRTVQNIIKLTSYLVIVLFVLDPENWIIVVLCIVLYNNTRVAYVHRRLVRRRVQYWT